MAHAVEDCARRFLERHLVRLGQCARAGVLHEDEERERVRIELAAFTAIGALADDEVATWANRFDRALGAFQADGVLEVSEGTRMRVRRLFEGLRASNPDDPLKDVRLACAVRALEAVGAVPPGHAQRSGIGRADERLAVAIHTEAEDAFGRTREPIWTARGIRRVVAGPPDRHSGIRLASVEIYNDSVILQWHVVLAAESPHRARRTKKDCQFSNRMHVEDLGAARLTDDVGTRYTGGSAVVSAPPAHVPSNRPDMGALCCAIAFVPTVSEQATTLWVEAAGERFDVRLRH